MLLALDIKASRATVAPGISISKIARLGNICGTPIKDFNHRFTSEFYQCLSPSMVVQAVWATPWKLKGKMQREWAWGPSTVSQLPPVEFSSTNVYMNKTMDNLISKFERDYYNDLDWEKRFIQTTRENLLVAKRKTKQTVPFPRKTDARKS